MAEILTFRPRRKSISSLMVPQHQLVCRAQLEEATHAIFDAADRLIAILDQMEGDPDLEPGGDDEPSLGAPENPDSHVTWLRGSTRDLELDQQQEMNP